MNELIRNAQSELHALCRRHNVRRLDLFGSAVGTDFDPSSSDFDFLVEFGDFAKGQYADHYFGLLEDLKALFNRPIDLVVERAVRNPYLLENFARTRQPLYGA